MTDLPALVTAAELLAVLDDNDVVVLDTTWNSDADKPRADFADGHIRGARHFEHPRVHNAHSDMHDTVCSPEQFAAYASELGLENHQRIVCYSRGMFSSAARAWWLFRLFGHERVSVLEGGFAAWEADGHPTAAGAASFTAANFQATLTPKHQCTYDQLRDRLGADGAPQLADARPPMFFSGEKDFFATRPSPATGKTGNVTGSVNVPAGSLPTDGRLGSVEQVRARLASSGLDLERPLVVSCSLGVGAAGVAFALHLAGIEAPVFDGGWEEWAAQVDVS